MNTIQKFDTFKMQDLKKEFKNELIDLFKDYEVTPLTADEDEKYDIINDLIDMTLTNDNVYDILKITVANGSAQITPELLKTLYEKLYEELYDLEDGTAEEKEKEQNRVHEEVDNMLTYDEDQIDMMEHHENNDILDMVNEILNESLREVIAEVIEKMESEEHKANILAELMKVGA